MRSRSRGADGHDRGQRWFYWPLYEIRTGHIIGLATPRESIRDGMAVQLLRDLFPSSDYPNILVEPGRSSFQPGQNLIVVGWADLLINPLPNGPPAAEAPARVGAEKLATIRALYDRSCYRIVDDERGRHILNQVTGMRYVPSRLDGGIEINFGGIRRWCLGQTGKNTFVVEGDRRLGTIAAAIVAANPNYLNVFHDSLHKLSGYDDSLPLEILVRGVFRPEDEPIYSLDRIEAEPIAMIYNREWVYDFKGGWRDYIPWTIRLGIASDGHVSPVPPESHDDVPRLELKLDLRRDRGPLPELCRRVLIDGVAKRRPPSTADASRLIQELSLESERCTLELWRSDLGGQPRCQTLPEPRGGKRDLNKRFLIQLLVGRFLGQPVRVAHQEIVGCYPTLRPMVERDGPQRVEHYFVRQIAGKWRDGMEALLGDRRTADPMLVDRAWDPGGHGYSLQPLGQTRFVLTICLASPTAP